jgi:CheY-like chemotaxis protein
MSDRSSAKPLAGRRIFLAEDGPDNQHLISLRLRQVGAAVELAENGRIALEMVLSAEASGQPYDLVFMDMQMPEMDGYTATSRLRDAGYRRPIIALTAHAMSGDRERCLAAGCDEYATKPIDHRRMVELAVSEIARFAGTDVAAARQASPSQATADTHDDGPVASELADDPDMCEAIDRYVVRLRATGDSLARVLAGEPLPDLIRVVHQIKGAAGGYGFPAITKAAGELEACLKEAGALTPALSQRERELTPERDRLLARLIDLCRRAQPATSAGSAAAPVETAR